MHAKIKRDLALALAMLMMLVWPCAAFSEVAMDEAMPMQTRPDVTDYVNRDIPQELVIASTTEMAGNFFTEKWGNNTADTDVRQLLHGLSTVAWEQNGNYAIDTTVVEEIKLTDLNGDHVYEFTIKGDLAYNDGTPITAKDYVFSTLLLCSKEFNALGGVPTAKEYLTGFDRYYEEGGAFSGVRLLGEYSFSLSIDKAYLPYFYEVVLAGATPYPMAAIAPGCEVADDGQGAYLVGLNEDVLRETILGEAGYLHAPKVTSGPYSLVSYDAQANEARFEKNPHYKGNYEGQVPIIERLTFRWAAPENLIAELQNGAVDVVNKVSDGSIINAAMSEFQMYNYLRSGFSFLSFACEEGPAASENVRRAIAHLVDAPALCEQFLGGMGMPVYGYYGMGQWMAQENMAALQELAVELDSGEAVRLLQADGWTLNEAGENYDEDAGGLRYRRNEVGELQPLRLKWAQPVGSETTNILREMLTEEAEAVGMAFEITELPFSEILQHYYRQSDRTYDMFNLATNFTLAFDPYPVFHLGDEYQGEFNTTGIRDEELMRLTKDMRETEVGDNEAYATKWLAFQRRIAEVMPVVPLYSNVYFDFARNDLQQYAPSAHFSWASAIVYAYIGEPIPMAEGAEPMDGEGAPDSGEGEDGLTTLD